MKKKIIMLATFMFVAMAGCGQIEETTTFVQNNDNEENQTMTRIDTPTEADTDIVTKEIATETVITSLIQQTTEPETEDEVTIADNQENSSAESEIMNDIINENNSQPQTEIEQSATEIDNSVVTDENTIQEVVPSETTDSPYIPNDEQTSDIFRMLDDLDYQAVSCDGLPDYTLTAPDGTIYYISISSNWVWRQPSLIDGADNEATLTKEVIDALYEEWDNLNIVESIS